MENTSLINFLKQNPLFRDIPMDLLETLAGDMSLVHVLGGQYLMRAGEQGHTMYLLVHGRMRVYTDENDPHAIREIGVGEAVGELAILTDMPRSATVVAIRDSTLVKITEETFRRWVKLHPDSAVQMISRSIKRLLPNTQTRHQPITALAIVPAQADLDTREVCNALVKAMMPYKKCLLLTADNQKVQEAIAKGETVSLEYLNECADQYDLLIYVATPDLNEWSKQCVRQSDQVLMLCSATSFTPLPVIDYLSTDNHTFAKKILVVLHRSQTELPKHTDKLIQATKADSVFHIQHSSDYERIGRFFTGNAISLVFSGGGLRGAAHIGLYFALEENNIPIDMFAGTSFGALVAAGMAQRLPRARLNEILDMANRTLPGLMDYTLPVASLLRGEKLYELLTSAFAPDVLLEDLWLPSFCIGTNLSDSKIEIFDRGPAWEAVRASMSLPGIFSPVTHNGKVIIDGGSLNNLPVDIMADRNQGGKIIASNVGSALPDEFYHAESAHVSGVDVLADRFRVEPHTHLPSLLDILVNVGFIGSRQHLKIAKPLCDYYIDLDLSAYPMMDLKHWNEIIDKGHEQGLKWIKELGITRETLGIK